MNWPPWLPRLAPPAFLAPLAPPGRACWAAAGAAWLAFGAAACTPHIGNSCNLNTDCSIDNTRQCDNSQSDGYCTVFNCAPNSCPDNAVCVEFQAGVPGCPYDDYASPSRSGRSFCMKACGHPSDCRQDEGYACLSVQDFDQAGIAAIILDNNQAQLVCAIPPDPASANPSGVPAVCPGGSVPDAGSLPLVDSGALAADGGIDATLDASDASDASDATSPSQDASSDVVAEGGGDALADAPEDATMTDGADAADAGGG